MTETDSARDLGSLVVPAAGALVATGDLCVPYYLSGPDGGRVVPVSEFLRDLQATGRPATTQRIDPAQRSRLEEIRDNLLDRIAEAEREGWTGEAEGLKVNLAAANNKLAQADLTAGRRAEHVHLGIPAYRDITAATLTAPEPPVNINDLAAALRACAALLSNGTFLHCDDFTSQFTEHGTCDGIAMTASDWHAALTALQAGPTPLLRRETLTGLDGPNTAELLTEIRHGRHIS